MTRFENKVVMFDDIQITCSGWKCSSCGEIAVDKNINTIEMEEKK
jgi:hypothetical protein